MKKAKTYKSSIFAAIHETAEGMFDAGVIETWYRKSGHKVKSG